jgi:hypothetical protein
MSYLGKLRPGKLLEPLRLVVYGQAGVGKSTFAAAAPDSLYIDCEKRTGHLDIKNRFQPGSWDEIMGVLSELHAAPGSYKHVVVDSLDHAEMLMHGQLCAAQNVTSIQEVDGGYGKGYDAAILQWRRLLRVLEALKFKGLGSILLAHPMIREYKNPLGDNFDTYDLKLKGGPKTNASDLFKESVDLIGFAHFEDFARKRDKTDKTAKALTTGSRVMSFAHNPAYTSKRGVPFPDEIPLSWDAYIKAMESK